MKKTGKEIRETEGQFIMQQEVVYWEKIPTSNNPTFLNGRPDLSEITNHPDWNDKVKAFTVTDVQQNSVKYIPELVQIAEMFYDHLTSEGLQKGMTFQLVEKTLNDIAGTNKE